MKGFKIIKVIGLMLGLAIFAYYIHHLGPARIGEALLQIRWWAFAVLLNSLLWYLFYTAAWMSYFGNLTHTMPFTHLLRIKICGEAVNLMTPVGFVAGDPVRVLLLKKQFGSSTRLGSVLVDRLLHSLATLCFVTVGMVITFSRNVLITSNYRWVAVGIYGLIIALLAFLAAELMRGHGFKRFHNLLHRFGFDKRFPKLDERVLRLNEELSGFAGGQVAPFLKAFFYHFFGRCLGAMEIAIIFLALTGDPHFLYAIMLASLTSVTHFLFSFIPGGFGLVESLYGSFFGYFGMDPVLGVSMQLLRRLRAIFWIGVGVVLLQAHGRSKGEEAGAQKNP